MTNPHTPDIPRQRSPQWLRAARWQLRLLAPHVLLTWAVGVVSVIIILGILSQRMEITVSAVSVAIHALFWWYFALTIVMAMTYLPAHVAHGMSRRSFTLAALAMSLVLATINAAFLTLAVVIERAAYAALGWSPALSAGNVPEPLAGGAELAFAGGLFVLLTAGALSGLLVGTAYYRLGWLWGTIVLALTLSPVAAATQLVLNESQWRPMNVSLLGDLPAGDLLGVALLLAGAAGFALLTRRIPIHSRAS